MADSGSEVNLAHGSLVSVIIPCRNERNFIQECLDSIVSQDVSPHRIEILVVDGDSDDGTPEIVRDYARLHPSVRVLRNPAKVTPTALNIGINGSAGEYIARVDAHSRCGADYFKTCLSAMTETGADNVGGVWHIVPRDVTPFGLAIAAALSHPFGAGNALYRTGTKERKEVDTVPFGFYRRDVFDRIGTFNEQLVRGQDMEFNLRLLRSGGRILLDPKIHSYYLARSDIGSFARHNFQDGFWVTYASKFAHLPVSWRHLVPLLFVSTIMISFLVSFLIPVFLWVLVFTVILYFAVSLSFSLRVALQRRMPQYLVTLPLVFLVRHIAYGLGSLRGLIALIRP